MKRELMPRLEHSVREAWRRRRAVRSMRVLGVFASIASVLCIALLVVDATSPLAWWVRGGALVAIAIPILVGLAFALRRAVARIGAGERAALLDDLEHAWGVSPGVLRAPDELARQSADDAVTRALIGRAAAEGEAAIAGVHSAAVVDGFPPVLRAWRGTLASLLVLGAFWAHDAGALGIVAQRLADPLGDHPPVSPTRVSLGLVSSPVLAGDRPTVSVSCVGASVDTVWLDVNGTRIDLRGNADGAWTGTLGTVWSPIEVRAHTPTGYSRALRIEPMMLARILETRVTVVPPAHAIGVAPERVVSAGRTVACTEGASLRVELVTSIPALGVRDEKGAVIGATNERTVVVERAAATGAWTFTPVTDAGEGPGSASVDVLVRADATPEVRFVGVRDVVTVVEGERLELRATASDDVALDGRGLQMYVDDREGTGALVDHRNARASIVIEGEHAGDEMLVRAIASDTVPGRAASEAKVRVRVISREEARERRLETLTIDALVDPAERAVEAIQAANVGSATALQDAAGVLDDVAEHGGTDFDEQAAEAAEDLRERLERDGASRSTALEAERTLGAPAQRLRLADALRRAAEALVRVTERQGALADHVSIDGYDVAEASGEQDVLADTLLRITGDLRTLGEQASAAPMDPERLDVLCEGLGAERAHLLAVCEALDESDDARRLLDLALTDLFFTTEAMLAEDADEAVLFENSSGVSALMGRMLSIEEQIGDAAVREALLIVRELALALGREATPALPVMGASALVLADRIEADGIVGVMRSASAALEHEPRAGAAFTREAHGLLEALREVSASGEGEGSSGDAPLSLSGGGGEETSASERSSSGTSSAGGAESALDRLAENRRRDGAGDEAEPTATDGERESAERAPEGGDTSASGGGAGGAGGLALGGSSVDGADDAAGTSPVVRPDEARGVARWVEAETLELTPGEVERLARVPERYRALVGAYLRALADAPAEDAGGSIEDE